jgi:hypothetical protein
LDVLRDIKATLVEVGTYGDFKKRALMLDKSGKGRLLAEEIVWALHGAGGQLGDEQLEVLRRHFSSQQPGMVDIRTALERLDAIEI